MIGLIFNEFLDFVDTERPGRGRTLLGIVGRATTPRYEPYERYDYDELLTLARVVARGEGIAAGEVLRRFGLRLFERLTVLCPAFRGRRGDAFSFLQGIAALDGQGACVDAAAAELLCLRCQQLAPAVLEVEYSSVRNLADLVEGMIRGCIAHCGGGVRLERTDLPGAPGRAARFVLTAPAAEQTHPQMSSDGSV
jgi:hypothetical protein